MEDVVHNSLVKLSQIGIEKIDESEAEGIYDKDWDNLIILDACRYDSYVQKVGEVDYRITLGSNSREYIKKNFSDRDCSDTVYISGNAHTDPKIFHDITGKYPKNVFYEIFQSHEEERDIGGPETGAIIRDARTAQKLFPEKRLVIHLMKPHIPFIAREEDKQITWQKVRRGEVPPDRVKEAYLRNLDWIIDNAVTELLGFLEGKTVITADHGQFLGENNRWAHPSGCSEVPLRKVPWHKVR